MVSPFRPPAQRHAPVLLWIVGICALLETAFTLLSLPPFGLDRLRNAAIMHGAFWPGLLHEWQPLFPGQRMTMFVSYAFLHGGFLHMLFNMLILLQLGRGAVARLGQAGFLLVYLLSAVGGAAFYGLLSTADAPMLGASGAVFGLFGTSVFWELQVRRAHGASFEPVLRLVLGLVVMNVVLFFLVGGMLAWQAHLGGFVTGFILAWLVTPTLRHRWRRP
ncbi:MAG: rhomboid family intramembrane serine protease [Rhodobacter sp.]|nr:rhomboid family intramembrane serine protease [Paracoccaceae bacterium]MCC0077777.1 rhomboid family intramembrane serine protease [Rhodobacter sp.]